jgi:CheY-like chemotaxis protein/anti-sigma regulatory factor (Ser/Thr protein kinase)
MPRWRHAVLTSNHADIKIAVSLPGEPLELVGDPERITQVLINLLNNAAKYTEPGGRIWVEAERENPGWIVVRVRDTGIGIDPALLPHIFEMFTQGARAPDHGRGGLGVGLALARSLVQMHNGTLEAHSNGPGHGAEFVVRLPAARRRLPELGRSTAPILKGTVPSRRILVVDDNRDQTQSLGLLLELMGHEVRLAHDGPTGLAAAAEFVPDVALIDIGLPGLSGHDVARRIREDLRLHNILLVAQTGWGQESDRKRSLAAGFDHHLVKPIDLATFQKLLTAAVSEADRP